MSKIELNIEELEQYIDNCKYSPLSNTKILVNREEFLELIDTLKRNVPDEIKKYQRIIANRNAILRDAQDKAEEMIKKANEMTSQLVSEHEIMQQAYKEANIIIDNATTEAGQIIDKATAEANGIKEAAMQYTDDSLGNIQNILNSAIESVTVQYDGVKRALESSLEVTIQNRKSLAYQDEYPSEDTQYEDEYEEEPDEYEDEPEYEDDTEEIGEYANSDEMSVEEALNQGQVNIDYNDIRYGDDSKEELTDFSLDINDLK